MNPEQRNSFLRRAQEIRNAQLDRQEQVNSKYTKVAEKRGYAPADLLAGVSQKMKFSDLSPAVQALAIKKKAAAMKISEDEAKKLLEKQ